MAFRSQARSEEGIIGLWIDDVAQAFGMGRERLLATSAEHSRCAPISGNATGLWSRVTALGG